MVQPTQPLAKDQPECQRPDNIERNRPAQAGQQRDDLRREIQAQRAADDPLAGIAQRQPVGPPSMDASAVSSSVPVTRAMGAFESKENRVAALNGMKRNGKPADR